MSQEILCFGELLWQQTEKGYEAGGSPFVMSHFFRELKDKPHLYSRVGNDAEGEKLVSAIKAAGHKATYIQRDPRLHTARATVSVGNKGEATVKFSSTGACDAIAVDHAKSEILKRSTIDVLCFGTLALRGDASAMTLKTLLDNLDIREVFYDVNVRDTYYSKAQFEEALGHATIVKLSDEEMPTVSTIIYGRTMPMREFADTISRDYVVPLVVITRGGKGCAVYHAGQYAEVKGTKTKLRDNRGTGDAFSAAFLHKYLAGDSPTDSAAFANGYAAKVASKAGATPSI